jgi:1,4-dihydroxy-2-naphthoate octaprenyltransferase
VALLGYGLGAGIGLLVVTRCEPRVLLVGIAGMALAFFYHAPPLRLSYRGLGEVAVAIAYGPLICAGTYLVQRHALPARVILAALPLGMAIAAFLWINEFPDRRGDEKAGKRTLVVRLGAARASVGFTALVAATWTGIALLPLSGLPRAVWLGAIGLPFSVAAARRLAASPQTTSEIIPAQKWTLLWFVLLSVGASLGLILAH